MASALGRTLVFQQDICDLIEARIRAFGRKMAEINRRQAYVIEGAEVLPNDRGTAPGQWIANDGVVFMLLPGPPMRIEAHVRSGSACLGWKSFCRRKSFGRAGCAPWAWANPTWIN